MLQVMSQGDHRTIYVRASDELEAAKQIENRIKNVRILLIEAKGRIENGSKRHEKR